MEDKNISMNEENTEVLITGETAEAVEINNETVAEVEATEAEATEDVAEVETTEAEVTEDVAEVETTEAEVTEAVAEVETTEAEATEDVAEVETTEAEVTEAVAEVETTEAEVTEDVAEVETTEAKATEAVAENEEEAKDTEVPLDRNIKLMSPMQMVIRRFFRSKLSIVGLIMIVSLFLFSFFGPLVYTRWGEIELDESGTVSYTTQEIEVVNPDGTITIIKQTVERQEKDNYLAPPSKDHLLGTDEQGYDVFTRLMYGGRISLSVSFIAVFVITVLGVILGGIAGYFGGVIDNLIMRICDVLMCLPGIPILLIISTLLEAAQVDAKYRIYWLMVYLTLFSWPGTARLVRGQILSLREQEYMVAAEAMGYSTA